MLRAEVLSGHSLFSCLERPWRDLAGAAPEATPFQTWEWQSTWFEHYGLGKRPEAFALYEGDDLVALMTFVRTSGPWRTMRPLGIGPSDYLHPLVRSGFEGAAADELAGYVASMTGVDLIDLQQLRETNSVATRLKGGFQLDQAQCLVLDLPKTYDEYLATLGKSLRYDVRKLDKTLFKGGRATIESVPFDGIQAGFDVFLDQHRARWRKRHLPGAFVGRSTLFHRQWIETASRNGWLQLKLLRLDGDVIGAIYAMSYGGTVFYYQAGFDPERSSVSPGTLLVADTIRTAIEDGKQRFDFMRGDESYKRRWKPQHAWANRRILIAKGPLRGPVGSSWNQFASRIEGVVRARLEGGGTPDSAR